MNNVAELVKQDMKRHQVRVTLPGEETERVLYLIEFTAKTSRLKDFKETYGKSVTNTHAKIARKVFGEEETVNTYGIFFDQCFQMVFAFNRQFADFNRAQKEVVYVDIDEVLVDRIEPKEEDAPDLFPSAFPSARPPFGNDDFGRGGGMLVRYSLPEKED